MNLLIKCMNPKVLSMICLLWGTALVQASPEGESIGLIAQVEALRQGVGIANPSGTIVVFAGKTVPHGWLLCDGSPLASGNPEHKRLIDAIGTTYNLPEDDANVSRLPDLRGRTVIGVGKGHAVDAQGNALSERELAQLVGAETHKLLRPEMPKHNHGGQTSLDGKHSHPTSGPSAHDDGGGSDTHFALGDHRDGRQWPGINIHDAGEHRHTIPSDGGDQPHNNMQPSLVLYYIIKL